MQQAAPPDSEAEEEISPPSTSSSSTGRRSSSNSSYGNSAAATPPPKSSSLILSPPSRKPPHRSSDPAWAAISELEGHLGPHHFKLVRHLGSGDLGRVYLCKLARNPTVHYAMKVVNKKDLEVKKKLGRAAVERRVLSSLDHPFLPTLYADFDVNSYLSCTVMEFCSGGDLHSLLHRQPKKRFPLSAVRFYAAEVLIALEYLHMMGILYRDLKPENVLIRADGHIMLSDFDQSFKSDFSPTITIHGKTSLMGRIARMLGGRKARYWSTFAGEPIDARSNSIVGTHEYVAPEVARGQSHGAAVDWWAFGVFLYELTFGRTPFKGETNAVTLRKIVFSEVEFPQEMAVDSRLKALIRKLLCKDPAGRLGAVLGAAEVKANSFFEGINFALLRSQRPPVVPGSKSTREDGSLTFADVCF